MGNLVIITGGSSGLGLAIATQTPFEARIVDVSRSGPPDGTGIEHLPTDLAEPDAWTRVSERIRELVSDESPSRSVFVHAAGTLIPMGFAGEVDGAGYTRNVLLNSAAGQVLGHAYLSAVRDQEGTHDLVMISSGAASSTYPGWSSYGAGKAALNQWVRCVGDEQRHRGGVRVSAIAPGVIDTGMQAQIRDMSEEDFPRVQRFRDLHEGGDLVRPEEAAARLWNAVASGLEPGAVIDLRSR